MSLYFRRLRTPYQIHCETQVFDAPCNAELLIHYDVFILRTVGELSELGESGKNRKFFYTRVFLAPETCLEFFLKLAISLVSPNSPDSPGFSLYFSPLKNRRKVVLMG